MTILSDEINCLSFMTLFKILSMAIGKMQFIAAYKAKGNVNSNDRIISDIDESDFTFLISH